MHVGITLHLLPAYILHLVSLVLPIHVPNVYVCAVVVEFQPNFYTVYEVDRVVRFTIVKRTRTTQEVTVLFTTVDGTAMGMFACKNKLL